ncbi:MAG: Hint domain-containing protein, partial [Acetobacteraceae bacterium]|nr:Hint domain-containing protein [Acetobacteraceae bacterium]
MPYNVQNVVVTSATYNPPNITVQIDFDVTVGYMPDHIGLILTNPATSVMFDISGTAYSWLHTPMFAYDPLDLSSYDVGTYSHTFTFDISALPPGNYNVLIMVWPNGDFSDDYYEKVYVFYDIYLCLCGGTLVATPEGERPVETLAPGDLVITSDGRAVPVRFVGVQHVYPRFARDGEAAPVRITAGALGGGLPRRDLLVSRRHA